MRLSSRDRLVFGVHRDDARVALDHPFASGHLGGIVVGSVALANQTARAFAIFEVVGEPFADATCVVPEPLDALRLLGVQRWLDLPGIRLG